MAKKNNKGFALIEIIIAIAILTILLTPIIKQLAQTMSLNKRSKAQQYATEDAEYVLEYFKANKLSTLSEVKASSDADIYTTDYNEKKSINCTIYAYDAADDTVSVGKTVQYTVYEYLLNPVELGGSRVKYERKVTMDDLEKAIDSCSPATDKIYRIINADKTTMSIPSGFEKDEAGRVVKYDADGYVEAIVCEVADGSTVANPNTANLGYMYSVDINNMAVVTGETVSFDTLAANDFYSETMKLLKNSSVPSDVQIYNQELAADKPGTVLTPDKYLNGMNKLTTVTVRDTGSEYKVIIGVTYENKVTAGGSPKTIKKSYTIKTLTYEYDTSKAKPECPDIYFEYQPFAMLNQDTNALEYAPNDDLAEYILFDSEVEDVKMYLIKPKWDQAAMYMNDTVTLFNKIDTNGDGIPESVYTTDATDINAIDQYYGYYIKNDSGASHGTKLVNICFVNKKNTKQVSVYTNLGISKDKLENSMATNAQFKTTQKTVFSSHFADETGNYIEVDDFDKDFICSMEEDVNSTDKLYSIRVVLTPEDSKYNTVVLTGAKGVN